MAEEIENEANEQAKDALKLEGETANLDDLMKKEREMLRESHSVRR